MDRITRKDLKSDKFAEEVFDIFDWASDHRAEVTRYGSIVLAVALVAAGIYGYMRYQAGNRADALIEAQRVSGATVGAAAADPSAMHFNTQAEKDQAAEKAYSQIAAKYSGSEEGAIAGMYLAGAAADKGNLAEAEKRYKEVVDNAPKEYAAMARLALGQVLNVEGKSSEAEQVLRAAAANPTATVSKEQATIALAQVLLKTNPAEAKKLLDPLRTSQRGAVARAAMVAWAELPPDLMKTDLNTAPPKPAGGK